MRIIGIVPARYASTRFPGKALASIAGRALYFSRRTIPYLRQATHEPAERQC